jgi:predicted ATP-grasp superfamily ATP-dependent carboligase
LVSKQLTGKSILIIALSARPFVAAAKQAGYTVTAIDAFADKQTVALADRTVIVDYDSNGFNAIALLDAITTVDVSQYLGFVYSSGFDAQPELLQQITKLLPLIGNLPATVLAVKTATSFFSTLAQLNITHPKVYEALPIDCHTNVYLKKFAGGCGGTHISRVNTETALLQNHYYQQHIAGLSVSLLFVADGEDVVVIGFNEQWLNPAKDMPFRYGGAVGGLDLPKLNQQQLIDAAKKLTLEFGLIGLNSIDAVVQNGVAYVLEINPRLSATFDLYTNLDFNLFNLHVQVCLQHVKLPQSVLPSKQSQAHAIVYAEQDTDVSAEINWPDWAVDTPHHANRFQHVNIPAGEPICTALADAESSEDARQLAQSRVEVLLEMLKTSHQKVVI